MYGKSSINNEYLINLAVYHSVQAIEKNLKYIAFFILIIPNTIEALIMIIYIKIKKPSSIIEEELDLLDLVGK